MATDIDPILNDLIARVGKVRRWLLALGVLKIAALWLGCLSVYVGLYALIDHHVHFQWPGRLTALLFLIALLAVLFWYLAKTLHRDMTYSHAANHVENKQSFDQQLVAVVEFYEGKSNYPYSKSLARQLVLQVDRAIEGFSLDSTIDKWHGYILALCVALCLTVVGFFIGQNVHYFTSYLTRLVRPFSLVEPIPKTTLESITKDIVTGPNTPVTLSAALSGEIPDSAELVLTRPPIEGPNGVSTPQVERIPVEPKSDGQGQFTLTAAPAFDKLEDVTYRFEAGGQSTESHSITVAEFPTIERITATVTRPSPDGVNPGQTYTEEVTDGLLEVLPNSQVQLQVQTNTPLQKATATGPNGQPMTQTSQSADTFGVEFTAQQDSSMEFSLVSEKGLSNGQSQKLQVQLKSDAPPEFELLSPDGDYLATDVASIPIIFKVTDDFGLTSAKMSCELPDGTSIVLDKQTIPGVKEVQLSHTFELEQYNLTVGDSLLFYAEAADIDTGQPRTDANTASEIYFIEIRPYQQFWHPQPGGNQPSQQPGPTPEDLITILEYTRAIVKRTWAVTQESRPIETNRDKLNSIREDLAYCAIRSGDIRDDPNYGFTDIAKAELSGIIEQYNKAKGHLGNHDAEAALDPEREAYRRLRKFIDELHLKWNPPSSGQSLPEDKPERVTMQEQAESPEIEAERLESQLEEIQQEIEKLTQEQESLKADLAETLDDQTAKASKSSASQSSNNQGQQTNSSPSSQSSQSSSGQGQSAGEPSESDAGSQGSSGQGQQNNPSQDSNANSQSSRGQGQSSSQSQESDASSQSSGDQGQQGNQPQSSESTSQGSGRQGQSSGQSSPSDAASQGTGGQGQQGNPSSQSSETSSQGSGSQGQSPSQSQPSNAASQSSNSQGQSTGQPPAQDNSLGTSSGQGQGSEGLSSENSESGTGNNSAQTEARLRMLEAKQKALNAQASQIASELQQLPKSEAPAQTAVRDQAQKSLEQAIENMQQFEDKLADIRYNPTPSPGQEMDMSRLADSAIRQLNQASQSLKNGLNNGNQDSTADQAQAMAEQLAKDAEALDESVDPAEQEEMLRRLKEAERMLEKMSGVQWATISGGGAPGASHVYTKSKQTGPAEAARLLSRQFWSIAVQARDRQVGPVQDEPSDAEFFELENEFFEHAARFRPERNQK